MPFFVANTAAPLIAIFVEWPWTLLVLVPIIVVEAVVAKKVIGTDMRLALQISAIANGVSTIIGIPLTLLVWLPNGAIGEAAFFGAIFLVPAFFVSVYSERFVAGLIVPNQRDSVRQWSWRANVYTYGGLLVLVLIAALLDRLG